MMQLLKFVPIRTLKGLYIVQKGKENKKNTLRMHTHAYLGVISATETHFNFEHTHTRFILFPSSL